jgi:hypothetical protein
MYIFRKQVLKLTLILAEPHYCVFECVRDVLRHTKHPTNCNVNRWGIIFEGLSVHFLET